MGNAVHGLGDRVAGRVWKRHREQHRDLQKVKNNLHSHTVISDGHDMLPGARVSFPLLFRTQSSPITGTTVCEDLLFQGLKVLCHAL